MIAGKICITQSLLSPKNLKGNQMKVHNSLWVSASCLVVGLCVSISTICASESQAHPNITGKSMVVRRTAQTDVETDSVSLISALNKIPLSEPTSEELLEFKDQLVKFMTLQKVQFLSWPNFSEPMDSNVKAFIGFVDQEPNASLYLKDLNRELRDENGNFNYYLSREMLIAAQYFQPDVALLWLDRESIIRKLPLQVKKFEKWYRSITVSQETFFRGLCGGELFQVDNRVRYTTLGGFVEQISDYQLNLFQVLGSFDLDRLKRMERIGYLKRKLQKHHQGVKTEGKEKLKEKLDNFEKWIEDVGAIVRNYNDLPLK